MSPSALKVMLDAVWDSRQIIQDRNSFMPKGQIVTARYYSEVIFNTEKGKKMRPRITMIYDLLLHYNVPSHAAPSTTELINSFKWQLLSLLLFSSNLALRLSLLLELKN